MGSEERLVVGILASCGSSDRAIKVIRDDVIDALYGEQSQGALALLSMAIDYSTRNIRALLSSDVAQLPIGNFSLGQAHHTAGNSLDEIILQAIQLGTSLSRLDIMNVSDAQENAAQNENVNHQWATRLRNAALILRPDFSAYFNRSISFYEDGVPVRFGFVGQRTAAHFGVMRPHSLSASIKDARSKLWELKEARKNRSGDAALILGIPPTEDVTLTQSQRRNLTAGLRELTQEADEGITQIVPISTVEDGASWLVRHAA
ncbi:hypothetical protein OL229_13695 [Neisseriaceae bacterium JH1-16]|nr:hypothetical protein [Neisseriaceae bacterium JH1-16]